jgi:hypothetical protein
MTGQVTPLLRALVAATLLLATVALMAVVANTVRAPGDQNLVAVPHLGNVQAGLSPAFL